MQLQVLQWRQWEARVLRFSASGSFLHIFLQFLFTKKISMDLQPHLNTYNIQRSGMLTAGCLISLWNEVLTPGLTTYCRTGFNTASLIDGRGFITGKSLENFTRTKRMCVMHLCTIQPPTKWILVTILSIKLNSQLVSQICMVYKAVD